MGYAVLIRQPTIYIKLKVMFLKTNFRHLNKLIFSCLFFLIASFSTAQAPKTPQSVFDFLSTNEGAALTLELDLTELINSKNTNQYFPGSLTTPDGKMLKMEVRPRGKFRRRTCDIPPLKLKFRKKDLRAAGLDSLNEVKLVVPCFDNPRGEELLLREYVAYRMFERLSPNSVRARLVKVVFRDRHVEQDKVPVYCLLVEHEEQVAVRLKGRIESLFEVPNDSLYMDQAALTVMFEFMIGNTDWGIAEGRNLYMLKPKGDDKILLIPYDFDFSGLVSAPYATPRTDTGLKKVQDRRLIAGGIPKENLQKACEIIQAAHDDLVALCNSPYLPKNTAKSLERYVEEYFEIMKEKSIEQLRPKGDLR